MAALTNTAQEVLSFPKAIKFNYVALWSMQPQLNLWENLSIAPKELYLSLVKENIASTRSSTFQLKFDILLTATHLTTRKDIKALKRRQPQKSRHQSSR